MFKDPYWNHVDVITWIIFRDESLIKGLSDFLTREEITKKSANPKQFNSISEARESLIHGLIKGKISAIGIRKDGESFENIPPLEWLELKLATDPLTEPYAYKIIDRAPSISPNDPDPTRLIVKYGHSNEWSRVAFSQNEVLENWPSLSPSGSHNSQDHLIKQIVEPKNKDEWYTFIILPGIRAFETKYNRTPNKKELWSWILENLPTTAGIKYVRSRKKLRMDDAKDLTRTSFNQRLNRYYPNRK